MESLLPHYERELTFLRGQSRQFADRYPKLAGRLSLSSDVVEDPHVERMIESFALLSARIHKRLDDDFPVFTESLLELLYPHYLRPFPSCSIVQFDVGSGALQMAQAMVLRKGTSLNSRPVKGVQCKFRTTQDVALLPLRVASVSYRNAILAPDGTRLPVGVTSAISITLELLSPQASWSLLEERPLRVFIDGEASQIGVLREALCNKVRSVMVQAAPHQPWEAIEADEMGRLVLPRLAGFAEDEALIDFDARSHSAYRLLTEYFAYPEKFNFVDLPFAIPKARGEKPRGQDGESKRCVTLHLLMSGVRADSDESRLLETIDERSLALGCSPVVNLFRQPADPVRVTHATTSYPVVVDARRAFGYEVYSIDKVFRVKQTPHGETIQEFRPFFSLRHEDLLSEEGGARSEGDLEPLNGSSTAINGDMKGQYWSVRRDEDIAESSPGYEMEMSIVDVNFDPAVPQVDTLSLTVTSTNRDLPAMLPFGVPGGDLFLEGGTLVKEARLKRRPSTTRRFGRGRGALWRLISHFSLNHLSLSAGGIDALKEMLRLYDLPRSPSNRRQIEGLIAIDFKPATAWLPGEPYATFVRGTEIRLTIDEDSFVGTGLSLFAAVLDRFFALYVHANSFTKLTLLSARTQEEVFSCPPRNGDMLLV